MKIPQKNLCLQTGVPSKLFYGPLAFSDFLYKLESSDQLEFDLLTATKPGAFIVDLVKIKVQEPVNVLSKPELLLDFIDSFDLEVYEFSCEILNSFCARSVVNGSIEISFQPSKFLSILEFLGLPMWLAEILLNNSKRLISMEGTLLQVGKEVESLDLHYLSLLEEEENKLAELYEKCPESFEEVNFDISPMKK